MRLWPRDPHWQPAWDQSEPIDQPCANKKPPSKFEWSVNEQQIHPSAVASLRSYLLDRSYLAVVSAHRSYLHCLVQQASITAG